MFPSVKELVNASSNPDSWDNIRWLESEYLNFSAHKTCRHIEFFRPPHREHVSSLQDFSDNVRLLKSECLTLSDRNICSSSLP